MAGDMVRRITHVICLVYRIAYGGYASCHKHTDEYKTASNVFD